MDLGLRNKRVLVTGGSKGIGLSTARAFAAEGAAIVLASRDSTTLEGAADAIRGDCGATVTIHSADLSRDDNREAMFAAFPDIDILVNNAGAIPGGALQDIGMDSWREAWDLKVLGYIHLCKLYAEAMKRRGSGTIVNIIGMGGRAVRPNYICGAAGNAALIGFTQALGAETPADNVRVFGINPSSTLTDRMKSLFQTRAEKELGDASRWQELVEKADFPFGRPKNPEEVGALATMLCAPQVHYLSGTVVDMDGGGQWAG